jgi:hypothetical protein
VADITYLRLGREFVYLAVVLDVYSRRVVGWELGRSLNTTLPLAALNRSIASRQPSPGLVHHSDRGTQYASDDYVRRLEESNIAISMSRPARPWENAYCESFMQTLKSEEIDCRSYSTMEELAQHIEEFIDQSYNRERLHSALAYRSPEEFENAATPQPGTLPLALSFPGIRKSIPMPKKSLGGRTQCRPPATHRDEFPAEYSLAGCSPAEPPSAFSAMLILNQKRTRWLELFSERLLSPNRAVSIHAAVHLTLHRVAQ